MFKIPKVMKQKIEIEEEGKIDFVYIQRKKKTFSVTWKH